MHSEDRGKNVGIILDGRGKKHEHCAGVRGKKGKLDIVLTQNNAGEGRYHVYLEENKGIKGGKTLHLRGKK